MYNTKGVTFFGGTLQKREGHSGNPVHWSVSPATYVRMKLWGV